MKLYEIAKDIEAAFSDIEDSGAEISDSLRTKLDALKDNLDVKADNIVRVVQSLEARAEGFKAEQERLAKKRKSAESKIEWLKTYIADCMQLMGTRKLETELFTLSLRNSERVEVPDPEMLPEQYKRTKVTVEPDKTLIKSDLKCGATIPGVVVLENVTLQIK